MDPYDTFLGYPVCLLGRAAGVLMCLWPDNFNREAFPLFDYCPVYHTRLNAGTCCVMALFYMVVGVLRGSRLNCSHPRTNLMRSSPRSFFTSLASALSVQVMCCSTLLGGGTASRT